MDKLKVSKGKLIVDLPKNGVMVFMKRGCDTCEAYRILTARKARKTNKKVYKVCIETDLARFKYLQSIGLLPSEIPSKIEF